ncbi:MAG: hypothetical protein ACRDPJ_13285 [Nocardioidaceae bacterium]
MLGEHHDSIVTQEQLLRYAALATADGEDAFTYGVLYAREGAAAEQATARFRSAWRAAYDKKLRRWLS